MAALWELQKKKRAGPHDVVATTTTTTATCLECTENLSIKNLLKTQFSAGTGPRMTAAYIWNMVRPTLWPCCWFSANKRLLLVDLPHSRQFPSALFLREETGTPVSLVLLALPRFLSWLRVCNTVLRFDLFYASCSAHFSSLLPSPFPPQLFLTDRWKIYP